MIGGILLFPAPALSMVMVMVMATAIAASPRVIMHLVPKNLSTFSA
jgi:hypothetical protein